MKWVAAAVGIGLAVLMAAGMLVVRNQQAEPEPLQPTGFDVISPSIMQLTSPAFEANQLIPPQYTCDGEDVSPPLQISEVPEKAQSLVLIMDDPDAPAGTWDHWIVFNIPPDTQEFPEGQEPPGVHGQGTSGNTAYHGPCPPDREHRYFFKAYALGTRLDLPKGARKQAVEQAMHGHILDQAELIGRYRRAL